MWDQSIELLTYGTKVERGRTVIDRSTTPTVTTVTGCEVQPGQSVELVGQPREGSSVRWTVWARTSETITASSLVRYQGVVYQVDGAPAHWSGNLAHHLFYLVDWSG